MLFLIFAWVLRLYLFVLWGRFIIEWVRVINPQFKPRGFVLVVVELLYTLTDPPVKFVRKILPPIRVGQISLDLGLMVVLFAVWFLIQLLMVAASRF